MSVSYLPPQSLTLRANLANAVSPLRRARSKTPFFRLPAHRIPTLWGLYRGLLRDAPNETVCWRVRLMFRDTQSFVSTRKTIKCLERGYKLLDVFRRAKEGDDYLRRVLDRYTRLIEARQRNAHWKKMVQAEADWIHRMRNRPMLTGAFFKPTLYNGPLPRMKPQPHHITGMIVYRRKAREARQRRQKDYLETIRDLHLEHQFEKGVYALSGVGFGANRDSVFGGPKDLEEWLAPYKEALNKMNASFILENTRAMTPFPPEMVEAIIQARRDKILNKTHERTRERRGEITPKTLERLRKRPTTHASRVMSPIRRHLDVVSRSPGEVGYVGMVKQKLGFKLRNADVAKRLEEGEAGNRDVMDEAVELVRLEMEERWRRDDEETNGDHVGLTQRQQSA